MWTQVHEVLDSLFDSTCCGDQSSESARWVGNGVYMSMKSQRTQTIARHGMVPRSFPMMQNQGNRLTLEPACIPESGVAGRLPKLPRKGVS